jgi:hypothetical protein
MVKMTVMKQHTKRLLLLLLLMLCAVILAREKVVPDVVDACSDKAAFKVRRQGLHSTCCSYCIRLLFEWQRRHALFCILKHPWGSGLSCQLNSFCWLADYWCWPG